MSFTDTQRPLCADNASALGIVNGYEDGSFVPNGNITRQEAAKMLYETAKVLGLIGSGGTDLAYSDTSRIIASYAINGSEIRHRPRGDERRRFEQPLPPPASTPGNRPM